MKISNLWIVCCTICIVGKFGQSSKPQSFVENISDPKEWKKLLRTRTNVLVLYTKGKIKGDISNTFVEVSRELRGSATLVQIDCAGDGRKLCKKSRVEPTSSYCLKHYKDGDFHKDYDRRETIQSMVTFLRDPGGDLPWDEDPNGVNVLHINDIQSLNKLLKRERSFLMMFYAPWCGFCKRLKPDYSAAATELRESHVLAAMDVNKPENAQSRLKYNITGFPTLIYFENGGMKYTYEGENTKAGLVSFMQSPSQPQKKAKTETAWADEIDSHVVHLTTDTFHTFIKTHSSVLVMFYAPWCGHCKKLKPDYIQAAAILKEKGILGKLAAVDATREKKLGSELGVKGYPTIKYFSEGQLAYDVSSLRNEEAIIKFIQDPKEPPPPPPPEKPWSEEVDSAVVHLDDETFKPFLRKKKHALVMFYAPWCGHCKKAKPEFTAAALRLADDARLAMCAIDCTAAAALCERNGVSGYPTFKYFNYFKNSKPYHGGRTESDFVLFLLEPDKDSGASDSPVSSPEEHWASVEGANHLHHLNKDTFEQFISQHDTLVMFYAPWCGHCRSMQAAYGEAASTLADSGSSILLATVDATAARQIAALHGVSGFPTLKFFERGRPVVDYEGGRTADAFVAFIRQRNAKDEL